MKNRANRPPRDRANVVCHGCNQKGHYKNECPNGPRLNLLGESDAEDSDIEVLDLGKRARDDETPSRKPGRPKKRVTIAEPPTTKEVEMAESSSNPKVPKTRRSKWKPSHFPLGEGQEDYSIVDDLAHRTMNITLPQLVTLSPYVRRELQQSISTQKSKRGGKVHNVSAISEDIDRYPHTVNMIVDNY